MEMADDRLMTFCFGEHSSFGKASYIESTLRKKIPEIRCGETFLRLCGHKVPRCLCALIVLDTRQCGSKNGSCSIILVEFFSRHGKRFEQVV